MSEGGPASCGGHIKGLTCLSLPCPVFFPQTKRTRPLFAWLPEEAHPCSETGICLLPIFLLHASLREDKMRDERDCPGARLRFCERMSQVASTGPA